MRNICNIFVSMSVKAWAWLVIGLSVGHACLGQAPEPRSSSQIYQDIRKLGVLGSVLYVAAHPDDENTRLLAWFANEKLFRTGYLSITRGDGGQNLIGDEQGIELGLIRTQELLAARRIDGAEQYFTRAYDFGYSKSTEEALRFWRKDSTLADMVWVFRNFRPDIVITRFPPDSRAGHGHHSASAVLAAEAFKTAGDPNAFPAQRNFGVSPWQPRRMFWNSYQFGSINTTSDDQLKMDLGGYNALLGQSYGEIAAVSRSQHKSQGFGVAASRGSQLEYFVHLAGEAPPGNDITGGMDFSWNRIGAPHIDTMVRSILAQYELSDPFRSVPALLKLYQAVEDLPQSYWRDVKLGEIREVIAAAAGLWMDAYTGTGYAHHGDSLRVELVVNNRQGLPLWISRMAAGDREVLLDQAAPANENIQRTLTLLIDEKYAISQPYWLREPMQKGYFQVRDQSLIGRPDAGPAIKARFEWAFGGQRLAYERPVSYRYTDPVAGEVYQPLAILPPRGMEQAMGEMRRIRYGHIPELLYFNTDTASIRLRDFRIAGRRIGYIEGAGDKIPAALSLMGYEVTVLREQDLSMPHLAGFDAIVTGVRAYNVNGYLQYKNDVLNAYVRQGGTLVVQYNTNNNLGPQRAPIGPYPFTISRQRVADEESKVRFLIPEHRVFHFPNRIGPGDFEGWVQERGIYFAGDRDPRFVAPLGLQDPGEEEQDGSLIIAQHGKGVFVYTGLVFFRQLPAGVNGAYRLFANILALGQRHSKN